MTEPIGLLQEVRNDVREVKRLLTGNGQVGLCEQVRQSQHDIDTLVTTVRTVSETVAVVVERQGEHREWHEQPDNMTLQGLARNKGVRFSVVVVLVLLLIFAGVVGVSGAYEIIKGLVT